MSLPPQLEIDLNLLKEQGHLVEAHRDPTNGNRIFVIFEKYQLSSGWNRAETKLLLIADISYPNSKLDMFWTDPGLTLANGKIPQAGEVIENYLNQQWQRFSWHVQKWNPAVDNIITYLGTVDSRLGQLT